MHIYDEDHKREILRQPQQIYIHFKLSTKSNEENMKNAIRAIGESHEKKNYTDNFDNSIFSKTIFLTKS